MMQRTASFSAFSSPVVPPDTTFAALPADVGIGLKACHVDELLDSRPSLGWIEVHTENHMAEGGPSHHWLDAVREIMPVSLHGVALSLGSASRPDAAHLKRVVDAAQRFDPTQMSEHVAWAVNDGVFLNDLLPVPMTEEALSVMARNVDITQNALKRPILMENPSTYLQFAGAEMDEPTFLAELSRRTGCGLLLDVNNVVVSAANHGFSALEWLEQYCAAIPAGRVGEIHLAGHTIKTINGIELRIDDHGSAVSDAVWELYAAAIARLGPVPTLVEWDSDLPALSVLLGEAWKARRIMAGGDQMREGHGDAVLSA